MAGFPYAFPFALGSVEAQAEVAEGPVRDFALDSDGDLGVAHGDLALVARRSAVAQGIAIRLRFFRGEYWLDEAIGVPYLEEVLIKQPNATLVRERLREAIADTPDVTQVIGTALQLGSDRAASISYTVADAYSAAPISQSVVI